MGVPKYHELYLPFLMAIQDGEIHSLREIKEAIAQRLQLSGSELSERLPSGKQGVFDNRVGWARTYLKKAGLIDAPQKAHFQITSEGRRLLENGVCITDQFLAEQYPAFAAFKGVRKNIGTNIHKTEEDPEETPEETLERVYRSIQEQLSDELLTEISNQSPVFFENLVVDLMKQMGYGDGFVTKTSGDGGIDGIIHEDKLGFNLIYIQAKRWDQNQTIGKPEIQKFAGAMMGPPKVEKGLFITTAKFSQGAKEFAKAQHIILVDGQKLTELMMEYGIGVFTQQTYPIWRIDSDYFTEE